jgi:hypothetical protein
MNFQQKLKSTIRAIYAGTPDSVHGVQLGYKTVGGVRIEQISIVFSVDKKLPPNELPAGTLLPAEITIGDQVFTTDVQEEPRAEFINCYTLGDGNIAPLQPTTSGDSFLLPMRGGQEIIQFPTDWTPDGSGGYNVSVSTLGFFCVDNLDNKIVGVTSAHSVVNKRQFCSERELDDYNTYDPVFG